jgi:membrane protease YdiL (CAAX protease family)
MNAISTFIKRYPLLIFFILAYALSWWSVPVLGGPLPYGPILAAIIVLALTTGKAGLKELFSQMTRWRVGWKWYLIAPGIVIAFNAGAAGLNLLLGAQISPSYVPVSGAILLEAAIVALLLGMWEEPGWTGYALPHLSAGRSLRLTTLILAVFRTMWHSPLFLDGNIPWSDIVLIIAAQIFISWLYYRTNHSLLIVMLLHYTSNFFGETGVLSLFEGGASVQYDWLRTGLACLIALGIIIFDRRLWFNRTPVQPEVVVEPVPGV